MYSLGICVVQGCWSDDIQVLELSFHCGVFEIGVVEFFHIVPGGFLKRQELDVGFNLNKILMLVVNKALKIIHSLHWENGSLLAVHRQIRFKLQGQGDRKSTV